MRPQQKIKSVLHKISTAAAPRYNDTGADKAAQHALVAIWRATAKAAPAALPRLEETCVRAFSQNGEDGCLLLIYAVIGTTNRVAVELCAGNGIECNTANLLINHGWTGALFDGDASAIERGRDFYATHRDTWSCPPRLVPAWITRENVNELIHGTGVPGEIDLLSLDLDGVDYWIWDAIDIIQARVVVCEYNDVAGPDRSITVPYAHDFVGDALNDGFVGASLRAFVKLAARKGYRFVGSERLGFNAFFVRDDIGHEDALPTRAIAEMFTHPKVVAGLRDRWPGIADRPWQEV
jgi:hypothetical protein